jgi:ribosomal protein S21
MDPVVRAAHALALLASDDREHRHCEKPQARRERKKQVIRAARRLNKAVAQEKE